MGALLLALCLVAGHGNARAQATPPSNLGFAGVDPGKPVAFDLRSGRIEGALPFDVQFYLQSPVDQNVTRVTGRYVQYRYSPERNCNQVFPPPPDPPRGYLAPLPMVRLGEQRIAIGKTLAGDRDPRFEAIRRQAIELVDPERQAEIPGERIDGEKEIYFVRLYDDKTDPNNVVHKVEMSVPAVLPNRIICFEFNLAKKVDVDAFRARATTELDTELRSPRWEVDRDDPTGGVATMAIQEAAAYNLLRRALITAVLAQLGPGERLAAPYGSFFDPTVNLAGVENRYLERLTRILSLQVDRENARQQLSGDRKALVLELRALIGSAAYKKLAASDLAGDILGSRQRVLRIPAENVAAVARGGAPDGAELDLGSVWLPRDLASTISRLEETETDLEALGDLVKRLEDRATLALEEGLSADDLRQLNGLLDDTIGALLPVLSETSKLQRALSNRRQELTGLVQVLTVILDERVRILGTSVGDYQTRAGWYISADVGVGFAPDIDDTFSYIGTNIYFRPVNKRAPLRGLDFWRRFSMMVGITEKSLARDGQFEGLIGTSPVLVAGGMRLNDHIRLSAGAVVFRDTDPNPLIDDTSLAWTPYVSLSIDWNLRNLFSNFGGAFGANGSGKK